jgi:hypothetical protein
MEEKSARLPLPESVLLEVVKCLCAYGGTTMNTIEADGLLIVYFDAPVIGKAKRGKIVMGTLYGTVHNRIGKAVFEQLRSAKHSIALVRKDSMKTGGRWEIVALAVCDLSKQKARRIRRSIHRAGGSLKPERIALCGEDWTFFQSE